MSKIIKRIQNYENLGLGLFIHWGLYSQFGQGEWTRFIHNRPKETYEKSITTFTAADFNPQQIVQTAKNMGAKYIVLTTKHHEGFFLYDTMGLSAFDALHSPAKRDLIQEFTIACREEKILPFFYMATYDWHNPLYQTNFAKYLVYLQKSVKLLCTNYGPIGGFWFDGNWDKPDADWQLSKLYSLIRKHQPEAIIINNTGLKERGVAIHPEIDVVTYERQAPNELANQAVTKHVASEVSLTLNRHWGHAEQDLNFKSPKEIIENIAHARNIGANILINIGLTGTGQIPKTSQAYLDLIGQWTKMAQNSIYTARPTKIRSNPQTKDFALLDQNYLYLFIHDLEISGNDNVVLGGEGDSFRSFSGVNKKIKQITWLDNQQTVAFSQNEKLGLLTINANGYTYGTDWIVRIAKVEFI